MWIYSIYMLLCVAFLWIFGRRWEQILYLCSFFKNSDGHSKPGDSVWPDARPTSGQQHGQHGEGHDRPVSNYREHNSACMQPQSIIEIFWVGYCTGIDRYLSVVPMVYVMSVACCSVTGFLVLGMRTWMSRWTKNWTNRLRYRAWTTNCWPRRRVWVSSMLCHCVR